MSERRNRCDFGVGDLVAPDTSFFRTQFVSPVVGIILRASKRADGPKVRGLTPL